MKKLLAVILLTLIPFLGRCEILYYQSNEFAYKMVGYSWSDWEEDKVFITIDTNNDLITIHSSQPQRYKVLEDLGESWDNNGGKQLKFKVIDQDGDIGLIRLRRQSNGIIQLYVEFSNIMWVYSKIIQL